MRKETAVIAIIVAAVAGFFVGNMTAEKGEGAAEEGGEVAAAGAEGGGENPDLYRVPVGNSPFKGERDALVTIVEFSDFECPFCSRVNPTIAEIMTKYRGKVKVVFKQNPLPMHRNAGLAAEAALAANAQGKFWQMHDKLFENSRALQREDLERYAQEVGLDMAKFRRALDTHEHKREVDADMALANQLGARGTPSFFINGRPLRGAQPFEGF